MGIEQISRSNRSTDAASPFGWRSMVAYAARLFLKQVLALSIVVVSRLRKGEQYVKATWIDDALLIGADLLLIANRKKSRTSIIVKSSNPFTIILSSNTALHFRNGHVFIGSLPHQPTASAHQ